MAGLALYVSCTRAMLVWKYAPYPNLGSLSAYLVSLGSGHTDLNPALGMVCCRLRRRYRLVLPTRDWRFWRPPHLPEGWSRY